jgi:hypothetical protein
MQVEHLDSESKRDASIPNWDQIKFDFEAGQISVREIAKRHEISHTAVYKRAKTDHWDSTARPTVNQPAGLQPDESPVETEHNGTETKPPETKTKPTPQRDEGREFSWRDAEHLVVPTQLGLAVYWNTRGLIVLRQQADWNDYDDTMIFLSSQHLPELIAKLQRMLDGED